MRFHLIQENIFFFFAVSVVKIETLPRVVVESQFVEMLKLEQAMVVGNVSSAWAKELG